MIFLVVFGVGFYICIIDVLVVCCFVSQFQFNLNIRLSLIFCPTYKNNSQKRRIKKLARKIPKRARLMNYCSE